MAEGARHILVIANETVGGQTLLDALQRRVGDSGELFVTVLGEGLLNRLRERAEASPTSFLIIAPQGDKEGTYDEAERRLRRALTELRGRGIEVHGQVAHPDPYTAAMHAIHDERIDEII